MISLMGETLGAVVGYKKGSSNGSSYGIGYGKLIGSDGGADRISYGGRPGSEVNDMLEISLLGVFVDGIPCGEGD